MRVTPNFDRKTGTPRPDGWQRRPAVRGGIHPPTGEDRPDGWQRCAAVRDGDHSDTGTSRPDDWVRHPLVRPGDHPPVRGLRIFNVEVKPSPKLKRKKAQDEEAQ